MKNRTYLAFDIDGTIYDSTDIIIDAFQEGITNFIKKSGMEDVIVPGYDDVVKMLGAPVDTIFATLFPDLSEDEAGDLNEECTKSLVNVIRRGGGKIFDDVCSIIEELYNSGYGILAASNGRREYVEAILETHDLIKFFSKPLIFINGSIEDKIGIVKYYKDNVSKENNLIMIGDRFSDREAALENNIPFIGCAFGHAGDEEIAGSKWIVKSFANIPDAVSDVERRIK